MGERDGILVVDKTAGPTSHDVVAGVRRLFGMRRVGHCGTLDPFATGVLVVCLGAYTRLSDWLGTGDKDYEAVFVLGACSDTGDVTGRIQKSVGGMPSHEQVATALEGFRGVIRQVPPAYSAVKVAGVRSYKMARNQQPVVLEARTVEVKGLEILENDPPRVKLRIRCSRGTYIRSLAADLGAVLGCGGYVQELRRLAVGPLSLDDAFNFDQLRELAASDRLDEALVPVHRALVDLRPWTLDGPEVQTFVHGGVVRPVGGLEDGEWAVFTSEHRLLGIGEAKERMLRPVRVFSTQPSLAGAHGGA